MQTTDTFVQDLRVYIKKEDEKPLLGPSFYKSVLTANCRVSSLKNGHSTSSMSLANTSVPLVASS